MLTLEFSATDLAHTRFAFSPLWEVVASIRVLKEPARHAVHLPWIKRTRALLAGSDLDTSMLTDLVPVAGPYVPDFLSPPPVTPIPDIADELAAVRAVGADQVRADLDRQDGPRSAAVRALYRDPAAGLDRLADLIGAYWNLTLAEHWPRIRALLEGDVLYRSRAMAQGGAARLFNDLDPIVAWRDGTLCIAHRFYSGSRVLDGRGLLLTPSAFVWPDVFSATLSPWQPTLTYPARGVATLWERDPQPPPDALAAVLGRSRTLLLAELDSPASTTELARRTGLSAGGVSQHLTALRAAGLVTAARSGRYVLYARTAPADALLTGNPVSELFRHPSDLTRISDTNIVGGRG